MAGAVLAARQRVARVFDPAKDAFARLRDRTEFRIAFFGLLLIFLLLYPFIDSTNTHIDRASVAETWILLALGLNIVIGFAGLLDLGYAAFFAIGAYTLAFLGSTHFAVNHHSFSSPLLSFGPSGIHMNFFLMIPIAWLTAAFCGVLFGAPTLRLRGDYLAIVTLGFGEIVPLVDRNLGPDNSFGWPDITEGVNRLSGIDTPPNGHVLGFNWTFVTSDARPWYYLGLVLVVFSVLVIVSLRNSRLGRAWAAIREDQLAAAHMGINITRTRLLAFSLGAAFSGFGGVIEASRIGSVGYEQFSFNVSIFILLMVILGGMGSISGVIVGAVILSYLDIAWLDNISAWLHSLASVVRHWPEPLGAAGNWLYGVNLASAKELVFGIILVTVMLLRPQGLIPSSTRARELKPETGEVRAEENVELYTAASGGGG